MEPHTFFKCLFISFLLMFIGVNSRAAVVESGGTIVIDSATFGDLYLCGGTVLINGPAHGDLVVLAGKVYINDTVSNLFIAGGTVVINGYVSGKIRCIGGNLEIGRSVQGDLVAAGGNITLARSAVVSGDLIATGANLQILGNVSGNIKVCAGSLSLYGRGGGSLDCKASSIDIQGSVAGDARLAASDRILIGGKARFEGPVHFWCPAGVAFGSSSLNGAPVPDNSLAFNQPAWYLPFETWQVFIGYLFSVFIMLLLLQYFFRYDFSRAGEQAYQRTMASLAWGLLWLIGLPMLIVVALISRIAIPVGLVLLLIYAFVLLISGSLSSLVAAYWVAGRFNLKPGFWQPVWIAMGCFVIFRLILFIPLFGLILFPVILSIAIGSLLLTSSAKSKNAQS